MAHTVINQLAWLQLVNNLSNKDFEFNYKIIEIEKKHTSEHP